MGLEAKQLLEVTIRPNMQIAEFNPSSIWDCIESLANQSVVGGRSYDAFIAEILIKAGAEAIVTFNTAYFIDLDPHLSVIDPTKPS